MKKVVIELKVNSNLENSEIEDVIQQFFELDVCQHGLSEDMLREDGELTEIDDIEFVKCDTTDYE